MSADRFLAMEASTAQDLVITVPALILMLEWAREKAKSDTDVHDRVEALRGGGKRVDSELVGKVMK
jgi:hypothetical protein